MTSGDVIRHSLVTFCGPLCLLRPLELGFGLSALLRMFGHGFLLVCLDLDRRNPGHKRSTRRPWPLAEKRISSFIAKLISRSRCRYGIRPVKAALSAVERCESCDYS